MDSIRKQIFKNVEAAIRDNTSLISVGFGSFEPERLGKPCAGVIPNDEISDTLPDTIAEEKLSFIVRTIVNEEEEKAGYELEDLLSEIHKAILADPKRAGLALDTRKLRTHWLFLDQDHPQAGADVEFEVHYATNESNPEFGA